MNRFVLLCVVLVLCAPVLSYAALTTDLSYGSRGTQVIELQQFLISQGYLSGQATGNFYGQTQNAVRVFQSAQKLPTTGYVGQKTRSAIRTQQTLTGSASLAATSSTISSLQSKVNDLMKQITSLNGKAPNTYTISIAETSSIPAFDMNPAWRDAIVNIYCMSRYGNLDNVMSGSGVIIDPRGIILTNAHVASHFIFADWPNPSLLQCSIRTGSPAAPRYKAALLYIPNEYMISDINSNYVYRPVDSIVYGKEDYALLYITGAVSNEANLPPTFPYLDIYKGPALPINTPVILSGYSSENFSGASIQGIYTNSHRRLSSLTKSRSARAPSPKSFHLPAIFLHSTGLRVALLFRTRAR